MNRLHLAVAAALLAGCATVGNPIYQSQFDSVTVGKSTVVDVRRAFGHPTDLLVSSSGSVEMTWQWSETETKATSFIPFAGMVGEAGTTGKTTKIVARFAPDGMLIDLLRGGATMDVVAGTVFQGYKTVGSQQAHAGDLPKGAPPQNVGEPCTVQEDCRGGAVCQATTGLDNTRRSYCIRSYPKQ